MLLKSATWKGRATLIRIHEPLVFFAFLKHFKREKPLILLVCVSNDFIVLLFRCKFWLRLLIVRIEYIFGRVLNDLYLLFESHFFIGPIFCVWRWFIDLLDSAFRWKIEMSLMRLTHNCSNIFWTVLHNHLSVRKWWYRCVLPERSYNMLWLLWVVV